MTAVEEHVGARDLEEDFRAPGAAVGANSDLAKDRPVIAYVINAFDRGGAEAGLVKLVREGLFDGFRLAIVALVRGSGGVEAELRAIGHEPEILLDRAQMRPRDLPSLFLRLRRRLSSLRPEIVIGSLPQANLLARLCATLGCRCTFISFEHNTRLAKRVYELGYRLTSGRVDWMFADALPTMEAATQRLYRRSPPRRTIVPLVSFSTPARRSALQAEAAGAFHIINAARFTRTKNQAALIGAVARLLRDGRNVRLTLYGDGPEREACAALASRLGIAERVTFAGFVSDWAQRPADLFVLVSRHEGLCIVALEAMHACIPVMTPLVGGLKDYAGPALVRVLPSTEPDVVADAIGRAMERRVDLELAAQRAAKMVDDRFGAGAVRAVYADVNRQLLEHARARNLLAAGGAPARASLP